MKEKIAAQEREFAPFADLLKRKFETDAARSPEVDIAAIMAGTLKKRAPQRRRLLFRPALVVTLLLLLTAAAALLYRPAVAPEALPPLPRLTFDDAERLINANKLEKVTILYQSGRADIQTDAPVPMVWVRKGEN
ncbi:MAG TPA: hypothetical protein PLV42_07320 [bacterium]|nr:hypothetical protein [bacterium]